MGNLQLSIQNLNAHTYFFLNERPRVPRRHRVGGDPGRRLRGRHPAEGLRAIRAQLQVCQLLRVLQDNRRDDVRWYENHKINVD